MASNMRTKWVNSPSYGSNAGSEIRLFEGVAYIGKVIDGFTKVIAMPVVPVGETAPSEGISFPVKKWSRLPLADRPIKDLDAGLHP